MAPRRPARHLGHLFCLHAMRWTRRAARWLSPCQAPKSNHFPARCATQLGADQAAPRETDRPRSGCWPRCPGTSDRRSPTTGPDCRPPTGQRGRRPTTVRAHEEGLGLTPPSEALVRPPVAPSGAAKPWWDSAGHRRPHRQQDTILLLLMERQSGRPWDLGGGRYPVEAHGSHVGGMWD